MRAQEQPSWHISHYTDDDGLMQNSVKSIAADNEGYIWLATEAGFSRFDGAKFSSDNAADVRLHNSRIHFLYRERPNGMLYAVSGEEHIYGFKGGKAYPVADTLNALANTYREEYFANALEYQSLIRNRASGQMFVIRDSALFLVSGKEEVKVLQGFDLKAHEIITAYYDTATHFLFLGSASSGLYVCQPHQFTTILNGHRVYAQAELPGGEILTSSGTRVRNNRELPHVPEVDNIISRNILMKDRQGDLWTADESKVIQFSPDARRVKGLYLVSDDFTLAYLLCDANNVFWAADKGGNIWQLLPEQETWNKSVRGLPRIKCMAEQAPGVLLVGTGGGLYQVKQGTTPQLLVAGKDIKDIYVHTPGEIWLATQYHSVLLYRNGRVFEMPLDARKWMQPVHCILPDAAGYLWITTNKGLFQASRKDMLDYADGKTQSVYYHYYGKDAGFNINEFNGSCEPCGIQLNDGRLSFPSMNGIVQFFPEQVHPSMPDKNICLDHVERDDTAYVPLSDTITTRKGMKWLSLQVSTPYFGDRSNLQLEYRLDAYDNAGEWQALDDQGKIRYTSLPPGQYTLQIRKRNGFGPDHFTYKQVVIIVPPFFYQTCWFMVSCIIGGLLGLYLLVRWRFRKIEWRNRQLEQRIEERTGELQGLVNALVTSEDKLRNQASKQEKINAAITHDIISPLQYMVNVTEILQHETDESNRSKYLTNIVTTSRQVYNYSQNLSRYIRTSLQGSSQKKNNVEVALRPLTEAVLADFNLLAAGQGNQLINEVAANVHVDSDIDMLRIVLHNLADNANKYTRGGIITIKTEQSDRGVLLSVSDTGPGMPAHIRQWCNRQTLLPGGEHTGMGLLMVLELTGRLHIELSVSDNQPSGTRISLLFPAAK